MIENKGIIVDHYEYLTERAAAAGFTRQILLAFIMKVTINTTTTCHTIIFLMLIIDRINR